MQALLFAEHRKPVTACCWALELGPEGSGVGGHNPVSAVHGAEAAKLACSPLSPTPMHLVLSCPELSSEGPRGSSVQDPSGRARSELAAEALGHCSLQESFTA